MRNKASGRESTPSKSLRRRAERALQRKSKTAVPAAGKGLENLVYELEVHQAELELQNEELQRTQAELARAHDRYRSLFDDAPVAYFVLDCHRKILDANLTAEKLLVVKHQFLIRTDMEQWIAPADQEHFRLFFSAGPEGKSGNQEWSFRRADGTVFQGQAVVTESPGSWEALDARYRMTVSDITLLQEARNKVVRLAAVAAASPEAIIGLDPAGVVTEWNPAAESMFGYSAREAVGRPVKFIVPPEIQKVHDELLEQVRRGGQVQDYETLRLHRNGAMLEVASSLSAFPGPDGRVAGFSLIERSVAQRRQLERELREAGRQREQFLAVLGHELRNPLAALQMLYERMRRAPQDSQPVRQALLEIFSRNLNYLTRIVDDLLCISRVMQGRLELQRSTVALQSALQNSLGTLQARIQAKELAFETQVPEEPLWINGDPIRLEQIFFNLLDNAVKYTDPGGSIRLIAGRRGDRLEIRLQDTGAGLRPEKISEIFKLFSQAEGRPRTSGGLGIGLALVSQLVALHHGTVTASSDGPGRGSEFVVTLPAAGPGEETQKDLKDLKNLKDLRILKGLKVLLVDDNQDFSAELSEVLEQLGCKVRVADSGNRAVAVAAEFRPRLVLLDIGLPDMDGCEAGRRITGHPGLESTVLIALTGYGDHSQCLKTDRHIFRQVLVKPVALEKLAEVLSCWK